jgi:DNA-binding response OmpR family regulator
MPEPILIVDDTPVNRKLTQRVLAGAGYDVRTVENAETALNLLPQLQPRLVLTDLRLPGMDGLALARRIKQDPLTRKTVVIALTGCTSAEDRRQALEAGCDDYLIKPIDTRAFPGLIEAHLARVAQDVAAAPAAAQFTPGDLPAWAAELCRYLLREGFVRTQEILAGGVAAAETDLRRSSHLWAGLATTLGYPAIAVLARRLEDLLRRPDGAGNPEVEQVVRNLSAVFAQVPVPGVETEPDSRLPAFLLEGLSGKRIATVGFDAGCGPRVTVILEREGVEVVDGGNPQSCDLVLAASGAAATRKLLEESPGASGKPVLLLGLAPAARHPEVLIDTAALDFAAEPCTDEEVLARACRLLRSGSERPPRAAASSPGRPATVLIADDDPTTLTLLKATLQNYGMDCRVAEDGEQALQMIRSQPPDIAILDIMMPNLDGFEVLAAIRNDKALKNVRVMLLTALQQETDVVRGFGLGADDYVVKPFSPVEIAARLKRLVRAET